MNNSNVRRYLLHLKVLRKSIFSRSISLFRPCNDGYVVLLPEVPKEQLLDSALQAAGPLSFVSVTTQNCVTSFEKLALEYESQVWQAEEIIEASSDTPLPLLRKVLDLIETAGVRLDTLWGLIKIMHLTNNRNIPLESYMKIHQRARRVRARKFNSLPIYNLCVCANDFDYETEEQKRVVSKFLLEGKLNGLQLQGNLFSRFNQLVFQTSTQCVNYKRNVQLATSRFRHIITDSSVVCGFPDFLLARMVTGETHPSEGPWVVTLQPQVMAPFMEYCQVSELRRNVWQAHVRCASGQDDENIRNSTHIEQLRYLRRSQAQLLGFSSFAQLSMQTKMAGSVQNVKSVLSSLLARAQPAQIKELQHLQIFATSEGFKGTLQIWDVPFWKRKQQEVLFNYEEEFLREYFPLQKVLSGLFHLVGHLFGIDIKHQPGVDAWHPDVQYYHVLETGSDIPLAGFYLDPYDRPHEKTAAQRSGGCMAILKNKSTVAQSKPLCALIFNFQPPGYGIPSLLSFRDVVLLFLKFGKALQHLLTTASYSEVAGLSNIEWDAVEVSSYFMTYWLTNPLVIKSISGHYGCSDILPTETLDKLSMVSNYMAGYDMCQELYLANLDLELHTKTEFWLDVVKHLWPEYFPFPLYKYDSHPCSFTAIFSGEWPAAYYSHLWARLVAADCFSAFKEVELNNHSELAIVGKRFRDTFLSLGGGCHSSEVFRRFRGRDPSPEPLLQMLRL